MALVGVRKLLSLPFSPSLISNAFPSPNVFKRDKQVREIDYYFIISLQLKITYPFDVSEIAQAEVVLFARNDEKGAAIGSSEEAFICLFQ